MNNVLVFPSFYSLAITGIILLIIFFMIVTHFNEIRHLNLYQKISLLCVIGILSGTHGLLHALFEPKNNKPQLMLS